MPHPIVTLATVAEEVLNLPAGMLMTKERGSYDYIAKRRQLVYYVAHEAGFSYHSIGRQLGFCHTTVKYGVHVMRKRIADPVWAERKQALEEEWEYARAQL